MPLTAINDLFHSWLAMTSLPCWKRSRALPLLQG